MQNEEDIKEFEKRVWELAATKDPNALNHLIDLFNDDCSYPEVMYSLVHAIETVPTAQYVKIIISKISSLVKNSPFWADCIINRILNDNKCYGLFKKNMCFLDKKSLIKLFDIMHEESPHHRLIIDDLRRELERTKFLD